MLFFHTRGAKPKGTRLVYGLSLIHIYDKARIAEYREVYRIKADELMVPGTSLLPHTLDTIRRLRAAGCKLGIVTSKNHARTLLSLDKFQLAGSFDVIVGFEDIDRPKPDPQGRCV